MQADANQIQYELNMAALRSNVKLLHRLQQQSIDTDIPHDGDDLGHAVSRLFIKYSHVLLRALEICQSGYLTSDITSDVSFGAKENAGVPKKEADVRDSVITGLSYLVIADEWCQTLYCDLDTRKCTIFVDVCARVLSKGTRFEPQGNPELQAPSRRNRL
ncbi:hypothetical protein BU15DRAFT_83871 [Melanogaster broomeanus]|nr:hypothetical protein BU15DRAFT_83871 [Melanogaster broomeanus]